jgi:hypothetical protein
MQDSQHRKFDFRMGQIHEVRPGYSITLNDTRLSSSTETLAFFLPMLRPASISLYESHIPCIKQEIPDEENDHSASLSSFSIDSASPSENPASAAVVSEDESNHSVAFVDLCSEDNFEASVLSSPITVYIDAGNNISSGASLSNRVGSKSTDSCVVELIEETIMDSSAAVSVTPSRKRKRTRPQPSDIYVVEDGPLSSQHNDRSQVASTVIRPFSCPICLEEVQRGGQACSLGCGHRLCFGCAGSYVAHKVDEAQVSQRLFMDLPHCGFFF